MFKIQMQNQKKQNASLCNQCYHNIIAHGIHKVNDQIIDYWCALCDCKLKLLEEESD